MKTYNLTEWGLTAENEEHGGKWSRVPDWGLPPQEQHPSEGNRTNSIRLPDGTIEHLPRALWKLGCDIEESLNISGLDDDWDQEGSSAVTSYTVSRAAHILIKLAKKLYYEANNTELESPQIAPYPDGGITLYWRTERLNILIHIPPNEDDYPTYSTLPSSTIFKGRFEEKEFSRNLYAFVHSRLIQFDD